MPRVMKWQSGARHEVSRFGRFTAGQVELAILNAGGESAPLVRREDQRGPVRVLAAAQGDAVVAPSLGARHARALNALPPVPAVIGGLAPDGAGQVHVRLAFLIKSMEARGASAVKRLPLAFTLARTGA